MNVTVIIPVYNAGKYVRKAVESTLIHPEVKEIILIEDGSPDNALDVCKQLTEEYKIIKLLQHPGGINRGAGASRNLGLKSATQEFITFLDADDYMTEIRFLKDKEIFLSKPDSDGVYGCYGVEIYDETGADIWKRMGYDENSLTTVNKEILPEHLFEKIIGFKNSNGYSGYFVLAALTIKTSSLFKSQIKFDESLRLHQDSNFIIQCCYYLKLYTGEYIKPVGIRGVHCANRFTQNKNPKHSYGLQYTALIEWGKSSGLQAGYIEALITLYLSAKEMNADKIGLKFISNFFKDKYFRNRTIKTLFNRLK